MHHLLVKVESVKFPRVGKWQSMAIVAALRNTSPHFHLVERGHVMKTMHGKIKGFKQGTFFFKRTVEKNRNDIREAVGGHMFKKLRKKLKNG